MHTVRAAPSPHSPLLLSHGAAHMLVALFFSLFLLSFPISPFGQPRGASAGDETKDVEMS